ncbi:MAG TPA: RNA polymerase sigma factor [Polyangiaceae bacterium]|nr:RNA polymerase sigma factor [Polyangiaceae bacterium]
MALARPRRSGGAIVRLVATSGSSAKGRASGASASKGVDEQRAAEREAERELCDRAKAGDKRALAQLLRKHGPTLYRAVLLPRLGSEAAAQDALADTYMRVVEKLDQFEWRGCGIYPWLRIIAMRIALDQLRGRKRETLFEPQDLTRAVENAEKDFQQGIDEAICEKHDREEARQKLELALSRINKRYAKAIQLRVLEEKSREEAAEALEVTVATFDVVLHRALKSLKKAIAAAEGEG